MSKYIAIRQNEDCLVTSFTELNSEEVESYAKSFDAEVRRWYGTRIDIETVTDGNATIYKVTEQGELFLESLSIIKKD